MEAKRNDPCPCGSGKKFKKCHGLVEAEKKKIQRIYSVGEGDKNQVISFAQKIIEAIETKGEDASLPGFAPSQASTKEAENPELASPRTFTAGAL